MHAAERQCIWGCEYLPLFRLISPDHVYQNSIFMKAVAAVGVAAATVQPFEIAAKVLETCFEMWRSAKGESKSNEDLGECVRELQQN